MAGHRPSAGDRELKAAQVLVEEDAVFVLGDGPEYAGPKYLLAFLEKQKKICAGIIRRDRCGYRLKVQRGLDAGVSWNRAAEEHEAVAGRDCFWSMVTTFGDGTTPVLPQNHPNPLSRHYAQRGMPTPCSASSHQAFCIEMDNPGHVDDRNF